MMRRTAAAFFVVFLFAAAGGLAASRVFEYTGGGEASAETGMREAKDEAVRQALVAAVRSATSEIIPADPSPALVNALETRVYARYARYVQGYRIESHDLEEGTYRTTLKVGVLVDVLRGDIHALLDSAGTAEAVGVVAWTTGDAGETGWPAFSGTMVERLNALGLTVLEPADTAAAVAASDPAKLAAADYRGLLTALAARGGRFAVVARRIETDDEGCASRFTLAVLDAASAEPVHSKTYRVTQRRGGCEAFEARIAHNMAPIVNEAIAGRLAAPQGPAGRYTLIARGLSRFTDVRDVEDLVRAQDGVTDCDLLSLEQGTKAVYALSYGGSAEELARLFQGRTLGDVLLTDAAVNNGEVTVQVSHTEALEQPDEEQ